MRDFAQRVYRYARRRLRQHTIDRAERPSPRHIVQLELHVTHECNLACESCSHYSNHAHRGQVTLADADRWMSRWSSRVTVGRFNLLGGEPTIHPDLLAFVALTRRHWPKAHIRIITNGFFLHKHPGLPAMIAADGNADIALSVHHGSLEYQARLRPIFDLVEAWKRDFGITIHYWQSHERWTRRYHGFGSEMQPFEDGQPRQSWEICPAKWCKQLLDGKIWKCAPLAYLPMQKARYDLSPKWDPYLAYQPLAPGCSDAELERFIAREDEPACAMCAARLDPLTLPNPVRDAGRAVTEPAAVHA